MPDLEEKVNTEIPKSQNSNWRAMAKNYLLDSSASAAVYCPLFALVEYCSGMDSEEILKSRATGLVFSFTLSRPYSWLRNWWADVCHADTSSSNLKKLVVDATASALFQLPFSTGTYLLIAGASLQETAVALPGVLMIAAISGRPYGYVLDKWRKLWGATSTLD